MRVFVLGDSFAENIYERPIKIHKKGADITSDDAVYISHGNGIPNYIKLLAKAKVKYPLHFTDYFKLFGYEVINFGIGGCSVYSIYNQFTKIDKEFKEGDRIVINWTTPCRFDWINEEGELDVSITGSEIPQDMPEERKRILLEQKLYRSHSYEKGFLKERMIPFMSHLINLHSKYKPVVWSPFPQVSKLFENDQFYFWEASNEVFKNIIPEYNKLIIIEETNQRVNDNHYGRYGNFYTAIILKEVLEYSQNNNVTSYTEDKELFNRVVDKIKNTPHGIESLYKYVL